MKKILTTTFTSLLLLLWSNNCKSQTIDSNALKILTTSFDKVAQIENLTYSMFFSFTSGNQENISMREIDVSYIKMIDKQQTLSYYVSDNSSKYVTKDSTYVATKLDGIAVTATSNLNGHKHNNYNIRNLSIYNMLGTSERFADEWIDTIRFYNSAATNEASEYIIDVIEKNRDQNNGTLKNKLRYDRYWINSQSFLPVKRQKYVHTINDLGEEDIDIYDLAVSFPDKNPMRNFPMNIFKDVKYRNTQKNDLPATEYKKNINLLGNLAPDFSAKNLHKGEMEKLSSLMGKVVLLDFWYLSCAPCRELMPVLNQINEKYKDKDFLLLGVNVTDTDKNKIVNYLNSKKYNYKQWYQPLNVKEIYNLDSFPTTVLIDKAGQIKYFDIGYFDGIGDELSKLIETELNK